MARRLSILLVLAGALASLGCPLPHAQLRRRGPHRADRPQVGQYAEDYRKEKAIQWLGREMPHLAGTAARCG